MVAHSALRAWSCHGKGVKKALKVEQNAEVVALLLHATGDA